MLLVSSVINDVPRTYDFSLNLLRYVLWLAIGPSLVNIFEKNVYPDILQRYVL